MPLTQIHSKVSAAGIAGAFSVVLLWVAQNFWGVNPPADVAAAFTTVLSFIAGYLVPSNG